MTETDSQDAATVDPAWFDALKNQPPLKNIPTVQEIEARSRRNRRKRLRSVGAWVTAGAALVAIGLATRRTSDSRELEARSALSNRVAQVPSQAMIAEPFKNPPPIRVYANVTADVPVFAADPATGHYVPVGWVETKDTVPVETGDFSADEIDRLRFLLMHRELLDGC